MPKVKLIHHVNIQISDRQRTREWYEKVLGAEFLDRGPALNTRQLQLRIGSGEMHFTDTTEPTRVPRVHFAVEVDDWDATLAHLDALGIPYSRTGGGQFLGVGGSDPRHGRREDSGENYTYIQDPDGNLIELVYHSLGLENAKGDKVEVPHDPQGLRWTQKPGFVADAYNSGGSGA
jgi:catechol 2,3-dioxygenase-like lactoylglutathione lyase family enzyme